MAERVIIEKHAKNTPAGDPIELDREFYVRLSVDESVDLNLGIFNPNFITVENSFGSFVTKVRVSFNDRIGAFMNVNPPDFTERFYLYVGKNPEDVKRYHLKLFSIEQNPTDIGATTGVDTILLFESEYWPELTIERKPQSWKNVKVSAVTEDILSGIGCDVVHLTDTKKARRHLINPSMTRKEFINWMIDRSYSDVDTFFTYSGMYENRVFVSSFDDLMRGVINKEIEGEVIDPRRFTISGGSDDGRLPLNKLIVKSKYASKAKKGATGLSYGYYDFSSRSYKRKSLKATNNNSKKATNNNSNRLSDWVSIPSDIDYDGDFLDLGGDSIYAEDIASNAQTKAMSMTTPVGGSVNSTSDIQVGERINILIPLNPEYFDIEFNEFYSGDYIVSARRLILNLGNSTSETEFHFIRQGLNSDMMKQLSVTSGDRI